MVRIRRAGFIISASALAATGAFAQRGPAADPLVTSVTIAPDGPAGWLNVTVIVAGSFNARSTTDGDSVSAGAGLTTIVSQSAAEATAPLLTTRHTT